MKPVILRDSFTFASFRCRICTVVSTFFLERWIRMSVILRSRTLGRGARRRAWQRQMYGALLWKSIVHASGNDRPRRSFCSFLYSFRDSEWEGRNAGYTAALRFNMYRARIYRVHAGQIKVCGEPRSTLRSKAFQSPPAIAYRSLSFLTSRVANVTGNVTQIFSALTVFFNPVYQ